MEGQADANGTGRGRTIIFQPLYFVFQIRIIDVYKRQAMVSVCGMEEDELQYLMGHDILDEQEMRSDFTDADFLARLWHKMNRRVLWDNIPENDMHLVIDQAECMVEGRSEIRAEITASCFADAGDTVILDVWNELPGDYISVRPNRDAAAAEEDITVDASYEPMQAQRAGRINIEQEYRDAVRKVRNKSASKRARDS